MSASRRGAVYWMTLAFGGVFLAGTFGGEVFYAKYYKQERVVKLAEEREEEKKIQKFANMEISEQSLKKVGEEMSESEKDVIDAIKAAKERKSTFLASREDYK